MQGQHLLTDIDADAQAIYDRMAVLGGGGPALFHGALQPYWAHDVVLLADSFSRLATDRISRFQVERIWDQHNEFVRPDDWPDAVDPRYRISRKPLWNTFFRTPQHLYEVDVPDFYLRVNPILHIGGGRENTEGTTTFINQRGLSIRGGIGPNVYFHTRLFDTQQRYANYINAYTDLTDVVPGVGFYKDFESSLLNVTGGRDYLLATGYIGASLGKYIGLQFGHQQHFIGEGIRSLLLSDFSTPFLALRFNTRIWKFHYQNLFAELAADDFRSVNGISQPVAKKYMAAHYLSFKASRTVTIGIFESVVFDREGDRFELQYLNPVILYRSIEGSLGSPDNVLIGLNARVEVRRTAKLYAQFMLDDLQISRILNGESGWWGNKYGIQIGGTYYNAFGVPHLDLQAEWNRVRPYTYSHYNAEANYTHYQQPLAHPLGSNFNEWIGTVRYQVSPRLTLDGRLHVMRTGEDADSVSYGGNVLIPNTQRPGDFGHVVGQGVNADILFAQLTASYQISPGLMADGLLIIRDKVSQDPARSLRTQLVSLRLRYNIARRVDVF